MVSHFSTIGLPISTQDDFIDLAKRASDGAEVLETSRGRYLRWASKCGAELWLQIDRQNDCIGMNPHFSGPSKIRVGLTARVERPNDTELDGAFHGWADPTLDNVESGSYPFVFDAPDAALHLDIELPAIRTAQLAAFAHEIAVYSSVQDYDGAEDGEGPRLASQSFIPSGLFGPEGGAADTPGSHAIFAGHVVQAREKQNPLTGRSYYWCLVDSLGGAFDVVIDPSLVESLPPVGGVVSGSFWLSGRLLDG